MRKRQNSSTAEQRAPQPAADPAVAAAPMETRRSRERRFERRSRRLLAGFGVCVVIFGACLMAALGPENFVSSRYDSNAMPRTGKEVFIDLVCFYTVVILRVGMTKLVGSDGVAQGILYSFAAIAAGGAFVLWRLFLRSDERRHPNKSR